MNQVLATKPDTVGLLANVLGYKHPELVNRFQHALNITQPEAEQLFEDVKKYLFLAVITGERLAPTDAIDLGWHEFLLYTRDYASFCNRFFGAFVHHTPNPRLSPHVARTAEKTVEHARRLFGNLSKNWTRASGDCFVNPCSAGDCEGTCEPGGGDPGTQPS
jgi:hypothetical protein